MKEVQIGNRLVGNNNPCYIVAEIGINHNGSVETATQLIDVAVNSGCDAVKFQKRTVDVVYTAADLARERESPFGTTNGDLKRGLEFNFTQYQQIDEYTQEQNIPWFASPWDEQSVDFLEQFNPPCYKVASASLTDDHLLQFIRSTGRPIILSTGMSTLEQVDHAVEVLGSQELVILHCVSTYPAEDKDLNLQVIPEFRERYQAPIGYSGHERGIAMSEMAVALGACMIERHITLDRAMWGSDQAASLEPKGLATLVRDIRNFEIARGDGIKRLLPDELPIQQKLRLVP